jgi:hypothetical protein
MTKPIVDITQVKVPTNKTYKNVLRLDLQGFINLDTVERNEADLIEVTHKGVKHIAKDNFGEQTISYSQLEDLWEKSQGIAETTERMPLDDEPPAIPMPRMKKAPPKGR